MRFGERIQTYIDVDVSVMEMKIPPLTLQPLVENAIIHGLESKVEGGVVHISGRLEGEQVILIVKDTGIGISSEEVAAIFREEKRKQIHGQTTGLGIINVHKRIQHYFGNEYGLTMESKLGEGTSIHIRLPYSPM